MSLAQRVTKGILWLVFSQAARRASSLIVTVILARLLLPEDFGLVALTTLIMQFLSSIQEMGLSASLVQRLHLDERHIATAFSLNSGAGMFLAIACMGLSKPISAIFAEPRLVPLLNVLAITLPLNGLGYASDALLQRRMAFKQIAVIEWLSYVLSGAAGIACAFLGGGVWALAAQQIASSIAVTGGRLIAAGWMPHFAFSPQSARELSSFSFSAMGYFLVSFGTGYADNALVGYALGAEALGYYALAFNLISMPGVTICNLMGRVMFPALSSVQAEPARFRSGYIRMVRAASVIGFPLIVGLGVIAQVFVNVIYGYKWMPAVPIIQILAIVGFFQCLGVAGMVFWAKGRPNTILLLSLLSFIFMLIGFSIGVHWGLPGIAWAYVVVIPAVFILPHVLANRLMQLDNRLVIRAITPPLSSACVMAAVIRLVTLFHDTWFDSPRVTLIFYLFLGAVVYLGSLVVIGKIYARPKGMLSWVLGRHLSELEQPAPST